MSKFTPGPWTFDKRDGEWFLIDADGGTIQGNVQYYPWTSDNEADWLLMAAAPEMYAVLDSMRRAEDDPMSNSDPRRVKLLAALAKAEARESA